MYACVCMFVCVCVCVCARACVCIVCVRACVSVYMCMPVYIRMFVCLCMCACMNEYTLRYLLVYFFTHMCKLISTQNLMTVCTYVHTYAHVYD